MKTTPDELKQILLTRWSYPEKQVENTVNKIEKMDEKIRAAFEEYLDTEIFPQAPAFFGLTPADLAESYPFKPPAVFMTLDWIRRDPQTALNALVEEYHKPLPASFDAELLNEWKKVHGA